MGKLTDSVMNKFTGRKMETIKLPKQAMLEMVESAFILPAAGDEQLNELDSLLSKSLVNVLVSTTRTMTSADEHMVLYVFQKPAGSIVRNDLWIHDVSADKYFELDKSKHIKDLFKEIRARISQEKASRALSATNHSRASAGDSRGTASPAGVVAVPRQESRQSPEQPAVRDVAAELTNLKALLDQGIITQEDFDAKKKQLLGL